MTARKPSTTVPTVSDDAERVAALEQTVLDLQAQLASKPDNVTDHPDNGTFASRAAERAARVAAGTERPRGAHLGNRVVGPPVVHQ